MPLVRLSRNLLSNKRQAQKCILLCLTVAVHSQSTTSEVLTALARVPSPGLTVPRRQLTLVPQVLVAVVMVPNVAAKEVRKENLPREIIPVLPDLIRFSSVQSRLEVLAVQAPAATAVVMETKDRKARQNELALRVARVRTHLMIRRLLRRQHQVILRLTQKSQA